MPRLHGYTDIIIHVFSFMTLRLHRKDVRATMLHASLSMPSLVVLLVSALTNLIGDSCTIPEVDDLSLSRFVKEFKGQSPVIFRRPLGLTSSTRHLMVPHELLSQFGNLSVRPANVPPSSGDMRPISFAPVSLEVYATQLMRPHSPDMPLSESWYLFGGDFTGVHWEPLLRDYPKPLDSAADGGYLTWGLGGLYSGVTFHRHGAAFSETLVGRKRWYIAPPDQRPLAPQSLHVQWVVEHARAPPPGVLQCTLEAGQVVYIPPLWWHATLNLEEWTAFVSTFTHEEYENPPPKAEL
jgi:hypothetical protein